MRSLIRRKPGLRADPAPSRWAWRRQRLMLTPAFRVGMRVGLPLAITLSLSVWYLADPDRRLAIQQTVSDARASIEGRPEFMVKLMAIDGVGAGLDRAIRDTVPLEFPQSSFDLDLDGMREKITALDGVRRATVRIRPGGVLQINVTPRIPAAVWRSADGVSLVDAQGVHVAWLYARGDRPDLPLIAGEGATDHVAQALSIIDAAAPLGSRLRGVVRMGARRWDVVLDRDQRVMLPVKGPVQALERVVALEGAQDVLTRDVARVDMRLARRPTLRMNKEATEEWWRIKELSGQ